MKFKILAFVVLFGATLSACHDRMTYKENTDYEDDDLKNHYKNVVGLISNIYGMLDYYDYSPQYAGAMLASASDEAEYAWESNEIYDFFNGSWSPTNPKSTLWTRAYTAIQACNYYLDNFLGLEFPDLMYNDDYNAKMFRYRNTEYEARFFRAYFYFCLVRQYGDVPFSTSTMTTAEVNNLTRTPAQEVIQFIADECDAIAPLMPADYSDLGALALPDVQDTGRATRLAVLALKARALLYGASPLLNTDNDDQLWYRAALANKAVIDSCINNNKSLNTAYTNIWGENNYNSVEEIFSYRIGASSNWIEGYNFPIGVEGGNSGNCPTQTMVDAYQMTDGLFWNDPASIYDPNNPYANRDPRFDMSIVKNGDLGWPSYNTTVPIETFISGTNGLPLAGATPTGYYLRKLLDAAVSFQAASTSSTRHTWVIFRLGEFYLNYAEAVFKYLGSADATSSDFPMSAREAASVTRQRTGVNMPALPYGLTNDEFWTQYTNERMVELAFEGHRFWDVRRWKEGEKFASVDVMEITNNGGTYTYTRKTETRQWDDKYYLFPIPQSERMKNPNLTQNPGWGN